MDCKRHHQTQEEDQRLALEVVGRHALLFDDDATAAFVNSSDALVPWSGGDSSLLIDRFDARHLLQQIPVRGALKRQTQAGNLVEPDGFSRIELDAERFRDIQKGDNGEDLPSRQDEEVNRNGAESSNYRSVPFAYTATSGDSKFQEDGLASSCYCPPFPVPQHLQSNVPPTEKTHQIISRTAKFVVKHGGQTEIILRVKQGGNPIFGFLMPDHQLHPYFRYLIDHPELSEDVTEANGRLDKEKTPDIEENKLHVSGGALSLLGSVYGSLEDDGVPDTTGVREPLDKTTKPSLKVPVEETKAALKESLTVKQKPLPSTRSNSSITFSTGALGSRSKDVISGSSYSSTSKPVSDPPKIVGPVVEPPSSLKPMVEKTAEFISRNGREFEASLIQQDSKNDKFPFLRPSNLYHSYYLKVLQHTREGNLPYKIVPDESRSDVRNAERQLEAPLQVDKKEKLGMALGAEPKPPKPVGLSAEEAAAIVMSATRGLSVRKQTVTDVPNTPSIQVPDAIRRAVDLPGDSLSKADSDSASDQQKLKAERLKRAKMFADMIKSGKLKDDDVSRISRREDSTVKHREGDSQDDAKEENELESASKHHSSRKSDGRRRHRYEDDTSNDDKSRHRRHCSSSKRAREDEESLSRERSSRSRHSHDHRRREKKHSSRDEVEVQEGSRQLVSETRPSLATDVPDDLRAKIRAMLLETL